MKNSLTIVLFCLIFNIVLGSDTITFHKSTIEIPNEFTEFSKEQLTNFKSTILYREIMTVYEKKNESSGLQRILFYYDSLSGIKNLSFDKIVELKLEVFNENGITFNKMKVDKENHCVYGEAIMLNDTSLFGFSVDRNGILGVQFGNSFGISSNDLKTFKKILVSIKHQTPYQYVPLENPDAKKAKEDMEYHGFMLTIGIVVMIFVWIMRKYLVKKE